MGARNKRRVRKDGTRADGRSKKAAKRAPGNVLPAPLSLMLAMEDQVRTPAGVEPEDNRTIVTKIVEQYEPDPDDLYATSVRITAFLAMINDDENSLFIDKLAARSRGAVLAAAATHPLDDDALTFPADSFLELVDLYNNADPNEVDDLVDDYRVVWLAGAI